MEAATLDSLWEIARQDQNEPFNGLGYTSVNPRIVILRNVWYQGQGGIEELFFSTLQEVIAYFQLEENGLGIYDTQRKLIVFIYDNPIGPVEVMYFFFNPDVFNDVTSALQERLTPTETNVAISRRVIDDYDPGMALPPSNLESLFTFDWRKQPSADYDLLPDFIQANATTYHNLLTTPPTSSENSMYYKYSPSNNADYTTGLLFSNEEGTFLLDESDPSQVKGYVAESRGPRADVYLTPYDHPVRANGSSGQSDIPDQPGFMPIGFSYEIIPGIGVPSSEIIFNETEGRTQDLMDAYDPNVYNGYAFRSIPPSSSQKGFSNAGDPILLYGLSPSSF